MKPNLFKLIKAFVVRLVLTTACLFLSGCESGIQREFEFGKREAEAGRFKEAVEFYEKVIARGGDSEISIRAAREASKISFQETKDYRKAAEFYRKLIVYSPVPEERLFAQRQIVNIYFDQLNEYPTAVIELNRLIPKLNDSREIALYKMNLAKAYFYQNNFTQARNEVDEFLRKDLDGRQRFDMLVLKANILIATKDWDAAIGLLKQVISTYPELSNKENVGLTLSVVYEEIKDFKSAIAVLNQVKQHHSTPEYIEMKIKRIIDRQKNAPGAKGPRK